MTSTHYLPKATNCAGHIYRVGGRVQRFGEGWTGTIVAIVWRPNRPVMIHVVPDDLTQLKRHECRPLNAQAAAEHGSPEFCEARDHGMTMGNFIVLEKAA
jgi:hypothetical protein